MGDEGFVVSWTWEGWVFTTGLGSSVAATFAESVLFSFETASFSCGADPEEPVTGMGWFLKTGLFAIEGVVVAGSAPIVCGE